MGTGISTNTVINIRKKRTAWQRAGKAHCQRCLHLRFGYYCVKQRRSAEHVDKPRHCNCFKQK